MNTTEMLVKIMNCIEPEETVAEIAQKLAEICVEHPFEFHRAIAVYLAINEKIRVVSPDIQAMMQKELHRLLRPN